MGGGSILRMARVEERRSTGLEAWRMGRAVADPERKVRILPERLVGRSKHFAREP